MDQKHENREQNKDADKSGQPVQLDKDKDKEHQGGKQGEQKQGGGQHQGGQHQGGQQMPHEPQGGKPQHQGTQNR